MATSEAPCAGVLPLAEAGRGASSLLSMASSATALAEVGGSGGSVLSVAPLEAVGKGSSSVVLTVTQADGLATHFLADIGGSWSTSSSSSSLSDEAAVALLRDIGRMGTGTSSTSSVLTDATESTQRAKPAPTDDTPAESCSAKKRKVTGGAPAAKRQRKELPPLPKLADAEMFDAAALPCGEDCAMNSAQRELHVKRCVVQASAGLTFSERDMATDARIVRFQLSESAVVHLVFNVLTPAEEAKIFSYLKDEWNHWECGEYKMYGKSVSTPRLLSACSRASDEELRKYKVTGCHKEPEVLSPVTDRLQSLLKKKFTYAQMNYYRKGDDYIGMHRDREVIRGEYVVGLSLGASRKMVFQSVGDKAAKLTLLLPPRSVCVMSGDVQENWKHSIPKMPKLADPRISLTFREH
ncbi:DNA oxidative demethylase ALKBH2 [Diplonema papillatum]|nr:DNA oxidative demethylase ALKBH2 [Diplonema papillatum]